MSEATRVHDQLFIGAAPQSPEEVMELRQRGVTALLSLQTDADLATRGLTWTEEATWCLTAGIRAYRLPIEDWSPQAVVDHLDEAIERVRAMIAAGETLLLHCTAGVNRSPSIALGYLVRAEDRPIDEALASLQAARPGIRPYAEVLDALRAAGAGSRTRDD